MNIHATSPQHDPNGSIPFHDESISIWDASVTVPTPLVGMGLPTLEVWSNGAHPRRIYALTKDVLQLGRDPDNDIVLHSTAAADFHAQIVRQGKMLMFVHPHPACSSTRNGLFYKGRHIPGHEVFRKPLVRGDIFRISDEHGGRTVVLTTHSVHNLYICDYICLLTPGGRLAFFGPPEEALRYFGTSDFVELYSYVEPSSDDLDVPKKAEERFRQSALYKRYITDRQQQLTGLQTGDTGKKIVRERHEEQLQKRVGQWRQFCFLTLRSIELLKNDIGTLLILLLQAPIIGFLLIVLIKYGIGTGVFSVDSIVQCPTSQHILTATGAIQVPDMTHRVMSISCARVVNFLGCYCPF